LMSDSVRASAIAAQANNAMLYGDITASMQPERDYSPSAEPTGLLAKAISKTQVNLSWSETSTNESGFIIERCAGSSCTNFVEVARVGANVKTFSNTGLTNNTAYRYRVRAYNAYGYSFYSGIAAATTLR
jgi:hypothetical protein